jgi:hypothetical protein
MASKGFCPRSLWSLPFMGEEHRKYRWGGDQTVPKRRFTVSRRVSEVVTQTRAAQKVHVHTSTPSQGKAGFGIQDSSASEHTPTALEWGSVDAYRKVCSSYR